jgi:hypothetical protein
MLNMANFRTWPTLSEKGVYTDTCQQIEPVWKLRKSSYAVFVGRKSLRKDIGRDAKGSALQRLRDHGHCSGMLSGMLVVGGVSGRWR